MKEASMPTYAIYLRKSRKDAEAKANSEGETLARHNDYAKKNNLQMAKIYEEIVSGESIAARLQCCRVTPKDTRE